MAGLLGRVVLGAASLGRARFIRFLLIMVLALVARRATMEDKVLQSCLIDVDLPRVILQMALNVPGLAWGLSIKRRVVVLPSNCPRRAWSVFLGLILFLLHLLHDFNRFGWNDFDPIFEEALGISS